MSRSQSTSKDQPIDPGQTPEVMAEGWMDFPHHDYSERNRGTFTLKASSSYWRLINRSGTVVAGGECRDRAHGRDRADEMYESHFAWRSS